MRQIRAEIVTSGEHLLTRDPNDEPASMLLERIRAERQKSVDAKTKRSRKSQPVEESIQMKLE